MKGKFKVVTLCGPAKFKEDFEKWYNNFTLAGFLVNMPNFPPLSTKMDIETLHEMHNLKIEEADIVFIVNRDGYIGKDTIREIKYATFLDKKIVYMNPCSVAKTGECPAVIDLKYKFNRLNDLLNFCNTELIPGKSEDVVMLGDKLIKFQKILSWYGVEVERGII